MDGTNPPAGAGRLEDLERLVNGMGGFVGQLAKRIRQVAFAVAIVACAIGAVALLLSVIAWRDSASVLVVAVIVCAAAIVTPLFVIKRVGPMAEAVAHPDETVRQARSYFSAVQSTPELSALVDEAVGLQRSQGKVRLRGLVRSSRLVGSLVESVAPAPKAQPLIAAFQPSRLRTLWLSVIAAWWLAIVTSCIAAVAAVYIVVDSIT